MTVATLLVVTGPSRGTRFSLRSDSGEIVIGRSVGTRIRLDDTEISRQHAVVYFQEGSFRLRDSKSANGTFVNGRKIKHVILKHGDALLLGTTKLSFQLSTSEDISEPTQQVRLIDDSTSDQFSAIVQQVDIQDERQASYPEQRAGLDLLYAIAELLVHPFQTVEELLQQILNLTVENVGADRGCVLLKEPIGGELTPVVAYPQNKERLSGEIPISRSITGHVLKHRTAVRTSDALHDARFGAANSILSSGIREAICAPLRGKQELLGVMYLDTSTPPIGPDGLQTKSRLSDEHLRTVLAVARQSALAVEAQQFQEALVKAERFAAMGQTVAVLSHHIKNILQGVSGGGYLIQSGLNSENPDMIRNGWGILERNQKRISDLVMDMLSFSRERVPDLQIGDINKVAFDVVELSRHRATQNGVRLEWRPAKVPTAAFDAEGLHRAILNIVSNAIDAVAETENARVIVQTGFDTSNDIMLVAVTDNGPGIPEDQRAAVFQVFESSKGERGTGIGLPVSRKIMREHGGRIRIEGGPGEGTRFVLSWPRGNDDMQTVNEIPVIPPNSA